MTGEAPPRYLSFGDLRSKLRGRSRASIRRDVLEGRIPQPIKLGRACYWCEEEVDGFLMSLQEQVDG